MDFLNGNYEPIMKLITERMNEAAENLEFETAIEQRELLNSVKQVAQKQKITVSDGEDKDIIGVDIQDTDAVVQLFFVRDGRMIGRDHFFLRVAPQDTERDIVGSFLTQFYAGTPFIPREIMLPCEVEDEQVVSRLAFCQAWRESLPPGAEKRNQGKACGTGREKCGHDPEPG